MNAILSFGSWYKPIGVYVTLILVLPIVTWWIIQFYSSRKNSSNSSKASNRRKLLK